LESVHRDLACRDLWSQSLERSHERRSRAGLRVPVKARDLLPPEPRDLTEADVWQRSSWRSRARRDAVARGFELATPSPRGMSLAALLALVGVPVASLAAGMADAPTASAKSHSSRKGRIAHLQRALHIPADGIWGPQTSKAVRRFQKRHGMTVDGIVGPATRSALGLGPGPVMKRPGKHHRHHGHRAHRSSARGGGVAALQRALHIPADGKFGPQTERAVKSYQRRHGMAVDGIVGPATRHALGLGSGRVLKRSHRHSHTGGRAGVIQRVIAAGNRIAHTPYVYGGGHGSFRSSGYDCSGSVSYALHGGGLLRRPLDSSGFMSYGRPGRGRHITIYANAGHAFMVVDGRRFDTSARSVSGSRWTTQARSSSGYVARHPAGL
jgi:peptidoglycan hydrolase-like protein with peptidoglycan-binding domain